MTRRRVARTHGSLSRTGSRVYYFYKSSVCRASGARHAAGSSQEGWPARCQTSRGRTTLQSRALQQVGSPTEPGGRARAPLPVLRPTHSPYGVWPGAAADEEDDFSSFGLPAGSPSADESASLAATEAATADDDDEFSEFGVPAYPAAASSLPAIDDDDDEFAEVLKHHTHTRCSHSFSFLIFPLPTPPRPRSLPSPPRQRLAPHLFLARLCSLPCRLPRNLR